MPTETAKALENITDRGLFEKIATSILKIADHNYICLNNTGININGSTRKAPIDAWGIVFDSNPPHFIYVEYTTTEIKSLENKWLNEKPTKTKPLGDLIKTYNQIQETKKEFPNALFTIILCSNKRTDDSIHETTLKKAKELGISLNIWWQDNFLHYLDNTPDGQYIRKTLLNIEAERISSNLLHEICQKNLNNYKKQQNGNLDKLKNIIERSILNQVTTSIQNDTTILTLLNGKSGFGKSTLCYQIFNQYIENNNYCLWVTPEDIEKENLFENTIINKLKEYCPRLQLNSFEEITDITINNPLLIIIDDINRSNNPSKLLNKITSFAKLDKNQRAKFKIICPTWPQILGFEKEDQNNEDSNNKWYQILHIGLMTDNEAVESINKILIDKKVTVTHQQVELLAKNLQNDPYLIGLLEEFNLTNIDNVLNLSSNLLEEFLTNSIKAIHLNDSSYLESEYLNELLKLSYLLIQKRNLIPSLVDIKSYTEINFDVLRPIFKFESICKLDPNDNLIFRHDRIREYLFINCLQKKWLNNEVISDDILFEPFYSEIIGQFLAKVEINNELIDRFKKKQPLALIHSINHIDNFYNNYLRDHIIQVFKEEYIDLKIESIVNSIGNALLDIQSEAFIHTIREEYSNQLQGRNYFHWHLINFKYGDTKSALIYFSKHEISGNYSYLYPIINSIEDKYKIIIKNHIINNAESILSQQKSIKPLLVLIGYLRFDNLNNIIYECWNKIEDKKNILEEVIWAILCCYNEDMYPLLESTLTFLYDLPDNKDKAICHKSHLISCLKFISNKANISETITNVLVTLANNNKTLESIIYSMLVQIDNPTAFNYVINIVSKHPNSHAAIFITDHWNTQLRGNIISENSRNYLKQLWLKESLSDEIRKNAFSLWVLHSNIQELSLLLIATNINVLSRSAILTRVTLADNTALEKYKYILIKSPSSFHWCNLTVSDSFISTIDNVIHYYLDKKTNNYTKNERSDFISFFSEYLTKIAEIDAEKILIKNWQYLSKHDYFIATAFFVGTTETIKLAKKEINNISNKLDIKYFLFLNNGINHRKIDLYVEIISIYLDKLSPESVKKIINLIDKFRHSKISNLTRQTLSKYAKDNHQKNWILKNNDYYISILDSYLKDTKGLLVFLSSDLRDKTIQDKSKLIEILPKWLNKYNNDTQLAFNALKITAECIKSIGNRNDLNILDASLHNGVNLSTQIAISETIEDAVFDVKRKTLF